MRLSNVISFTNLKKKRLHLVKVNKMSSVLKARQMKKILETGNGMFMNFVM